MNRNYLILLTVGFLFVLGISIAVTGSLYPDSDVLSVAYQSNGKLIVGGRFSPNYIERRQNDQSIDESFSSSWASEGFNREVTSIAILSDDSMIVGGLFTSFDATLVGGIARLEKDGSIDLDFARNQGTGFDGPVSKIYIKNETDGVQSIFVMGDFSNFNGIDVNGFAKLTTDGNIDQSFQGPDCDESINAVSIIHSPNQNDQVFYGGTFSNCKTTESRFLYLLTNQ